KFCRSSAIVPSCTGRSVTADRMSMRRSQSAATVSPVSPMETFQLLLAKKLSNALKDAGLSEAGELTPATDPRFGDYQTNAALVLGKQRGENPRVVAEKIVSQLDVGDLGEPPVVAGPGFINFTLRPSAVAAKTVEVLRDERLGVAPAKAPRRTVVEFC